MGYIRTESGKIFTDASWKKREDYEKIIKESDKLEELCDEFIYANKEKDIKCFCLFHQPITTIYYGAKLEDIETKKLINDKNIEIYGAIWTSKGLIYVAKMNDKGELVLLWVKG